MIMEEFEKQNIFIVDDRPENFMQKIDSRRILIAEDDTISRRLLESTLNKWGHEVIVTCDGKEALQALQAEDAPKIAILDWMMPEMDGVDVCREIRKQKQEPYIYLLLLTAKGQKEDIVQGMNAGADDYITKPFNAHELKGRLRAGIRIIDLHEELISAREELRVQATHDSLTGLWNRKTILDILKKELSCSDREGKPLGIIIVDIDHFKDINDTYGHIAGDAVLREAAQRMLSSSVRNYDYVARYGGEEFLVVSPGCDISNIFNVAERIRHSFEEKAVYLPEGVINVTCSEGVTATNEDREVDENMLIKTADEALYRAKNGGRNRVEILTITA